MIYRGINQCFLLFQFFFVLFNPRQSTSTLCVLLSFLNRNDCVIIRLGKINKLIIISFLSLADYFRCLRNVLCLYLSFLSCSLTLLLSLSPTPTYHSHRPASTSGFHSTKNLFSPPRRRECSHQSAPLLNECCTMNQLTSPHGQRPSRTRTPRCWPTAVRGLVSDARILLCGVRGRGHRHAGEKARLRRD